MTDDTQTTSATEQWECVCPECGWSRAIVGERNANLDHLRWCDDCGSDEVIVQTVGSSDD